MKAQLEEYQQMIAQFDDKMVSNESLEAAEKEAEKDDDNEDMSVAEDKEPEPPKPKLPYPPKNPPTIKESDPTMNPLTVLPTTLVVVKRALELVPTRSLLTLGKIPLILVNSIATV